MSTTPNVDPAFTWIGGRRANVCGGAPASGQILDRIRGMTAALAEAGREDLASMVAAEWIRLEPFRSRPFQVVLGLSGRIPDADVRLIVRAYRLTAPLGDN